MIRLELPSIADELDRADPRVSALTPLRTDVRAGAMRLTLEELQEHRRARRRRSYRS